MQAEIDLNLLPDGEKAILDSVFVAMDVCRTQLSRLADSVTPPPAIVGPPKSRIGLTNSKTAMTNSRIGMTNSTIGMPGSRTRSLHPAE
jgi:hypothetical protein